MLASRILDRYRQAYRTSREADPSLRYGRRTLAVSTVAQQFYCEKAVALSIEQPLAPSRSMRNGAAGHEAVAALGVTMTQEEAVAAAVLTREQPLCVYEFRIGWQHEGVTLLGFVDEAWFRAGHVELVAERKFSSNPGIHAPYHVQAGLYCLGLGAMGFSTDNTSYRISVFSRECYDCGRLISGACPVHSGDSTVFSCETGACTSQIFSFNREMVSGNLNWALRFWKGEREAEPTSSAAKCRACRYGRICTSRGG